MLEKKFKDILDSYLHGAASRVELTWMAEDLTKRRDRRDLFTERVEDFIVSARKANGESSGSALSELLLRDLSKIEVGHLEKAMPERRRGFSQDGSSASKPAWHRIGERPSIRSAVRSEVPEKNEPVEEGRSYAFPVIGILLIILVFAAMIRFSSIQEDRREAEELEREKLESTVSLQSSVLETTDFLAESKLINESEEFDAGNEVESGETSPLGLNRPVSLSDLVGQSVDSEESVDSDPSDLIQAND